jgi:hypothetical protein
MRWPARTLSLCAVLVGLMTQTARAVIFESTADPGHNTNAPTGPLLDSGWQYQGRWQSFLGTVIAPRFFLAAKHVGGSTNDVFEFAGRTYRPVRYRDCPETDLRVWEVAGTFPRYAPLYRGSNEIGQACVVFGRGTQRGAPVLVAGETNGWYWGRADSVQRWGENVVTDTQTIGELPGEYLRVAFDRGAGPNECHLSTGDSSGALFVREDGSWKLAGIHSTVDGYFSLTGQGNERLLAALLDMGGMYVGDTGRWSLVTNTVADQPSSFYSVRVSRRVAWLESVIDYRPGPDLPVLTATISALGLELGFWAASNRLYRIETSSNLVGNSWTAWTNGLAGNGPISLVAPNEPTSPRRFYRLGLDR